MNPSMHSIKQQMWLLSVILAVSAFALTLRPSTVVAGSLLELKELDTLFTTEALELVRDSVAGTEFRIQHQHLEYSTEFDIVNAYELGTHFPQFIDTIAYPQLRTINRSINHIILFESGFLDLPHAAWNNSEAGSARINYPSWTDSDDTDDTDTTGDSEFYLQHQSMYVRDADYLSYFWQEEVESETLKVSVPISRLQEYFDSTSHSLFQQTMTADSSDK